MADLVPIGWISFANEIFKTGGSVLKPCQTEGQGYWNGAGNPGLYNLVVLEIQWIATLEAKWSPVCEIPLHGPDHMKL